MTTSIAVRHNIEVAHRLFELPGKCENIHGHSMWVTMELFGNVNSHGVLGGIEFGDLKKMFRSYLDETYDHHLLLNLSDPFARPLYGITRNGETTSLSNDPQTFLPGLSAVPGDPTTENIAKWIGEDMHLKLSEELLVRDLDMIHVSVWETKVNMATWAMEF